jgi:hypothetical protein
MTRKLGAGENASQTVLQDFKIPFKAARKGSTRKQRQAERNYKSKNVNA